MNGQWLVQAAVRVPVASVHTDEAAGLVLSTLIWGLPPTSLDDLLGVEEISEYVRSSIPTEEMLGCAVDPCEPFVELWVARNAGTNVYAENGPPSPGTDPMVLVWEDD